MRRQDLEEIEEYEPFLEHKEEKKTKQWNLFKNEPRKAETGSTAGSKIIDTSIQWLKVITMIITGLVVLGMAVISKGSLLMMTSQIKKNVTRSYCNQNIDDRQQFVVTLPTEERSTWIWMLIFAYFVPEVGTLIRSVRILSFKSWEYPTPWEFFWVMFTEILPAIGSSLFIFVILPEIDVIKAAMLTNAICFVPAVVGFLSRNHKKTKGKFKMILDILAIVAQATAFVVWPLAEQDYVLYVIPIAVIFISFGWWENYVSEKSPINFISTLGKIKREFNNKTYFSYAFVAPMKCITFLLTTVVIIWIQDGDLSALFGHFSIILDSHVIRVNEIEPMIVPSEINYQDALITGSFVERTTNYWTPLSVLIVNCLSTYICYAFTKFASKIMIQPTSFAFPINIAVPVLITGLIAMCGNYTKNVCYYSDVIPSYLFFNSPSMTYLRDFISHQYPWVWLLWLFSQTWITLHIWSNINEKLDTTERLFLRPMYDAFFIDQSVAMNRRRAPGITKKVMEDDEEEEDKEMSNKNEDNTVKIYACGTMWHETKEEMIAFLKSILRMDEDQCAHRLVRNYLHFHKHYFYEFETHILFDDAYVRTYEEDPDPHVNSYVLDLIESVSVAASEVHATNVKIEPPVIYPTPYGGRLVWTLPGKTKMIAHLKDSAKIRKKKRWSQVMYMYYLLGFRIMDNDDLPQESIKRVSENTFILALDGDIDFQPHSVHLLVDYMKKNRSLGAACGRIHPMGSGAMAWYQTFEYAVGHWLQKATEHVIGCVLCSPGCFSLFRACALMDDNVMAKYTTVSEEARHYVQYDQGEDRWLCTLLLQRGYRVEYSAASDSYTHCPEGFNEFYNQRRRWMPSTTANILDLLGDYKNIVRINDNISMFYIFYQIILMIGTVIGPGTIFLMLVGAFVAAFKMDQWTSFFWNIIPILIFIIVCATSKADTQLFFAGLISAVYGLVMMAVLIGVFMQIHDDGWLAPSSLFFMAMAAQFIITAMMHPQEFYCLKYGVIYYVTVPSMYMLLVIYSIFNMNNVSWGTREVTVVPNKKEESEEDKPPEVIEPVKQEKPKSTSFFGFGNQADNAGGFEFSCAGLFKFMMCTYEKNSDEKEILKGIQNSLNQLELKLWQIERSQFDSVASEPRKSLATQFITGPKGSILTSKDIRRRSSVGGAFNLNPVPEKHLDEESLSESFEEDSVPANSWYYDGELEQSEVRYLEPKERMFWEEFIKEYLEPIKEEKDKKEKIAKDLKDLRDKMVMTFFMINCLFVLVFFLLTLQKDILHVNWPIQPKENFTYITDRNEIVLQLTYLELEPIGFVFLIFFALLMVVQFFAMMVHRFGTFCQIMVNTELTDFLNTQDMNSMTPEKILRNNPIKLIKQLIKLQGINDDDGEDRDAPVTRRNTAHFLALKKEKKQGPVIKDLDKAFATRLEKMSRGDNGDLKSPGRRSTIADAINHRRSTILNRRSQLNPNSEMDRQPFNKSEGLVFDNTGYEETEY